MRADVAVSRQLPRECRSLVAALACVVLAWTERLRRWFRVASSVVTLALLATSSAVHKSATRHARPASRPDFRNHPAGMRTHTVRRRDWREYRKIRLAALKNTPSAFSSTWREEASMAPPQWMERAQRSQDGEKLTLVAAVDDAGRWVGLAGGYRPVGEEVDAELVSMWVAPDCRGSGIGVELVHAVLAWAEAHGASTIGLWVNKANRTAISLYDKAGFRRTGEADELPSDPTQQVIRMLRCTKREGA
jgi:ribosomal protein S18 acetylase RimI-like enzyme